MATEVPFPVAISTAGRDRKKQPEEDEARARRYDAAPHPAPATASAMAAREKNTKSVAGKVSTRSVAPQPPPADSRCRSIRALASPNRFAGVWSWRRLCAVCRTSDRSRPRSDFRWARRYSKLASAGL